MSLCVFYPDSPDKESLSISSKASRYMNLLAYVITPHLMRYCQVVVLCSVAFSKQLEINDWTHANDIPFIAADTCGLFGYAFPRCRPSKCKLMTL